MARRTVRSTFQRSSCPPSIASPRCQLMFGDTAATITRKSHRSSTFDHFINAVGCTGSYGSRRQVHQPEAAGSLGRTSRRMNANLQGLLAHDLSEYHSLLAVAFLECA